MYHNMVASVIYRPLQISANQSRQIIKVWDTAETWRSCLLFISLFLYLFLYLFTSNDIAISLLHVMNGFGFIFYPQCVKVRADNLLSAPLRDSSSKASNNVMHRETIRTC